MIFEDDHRRKMMRLNTGGGGNPFDLASFYAPLTHSLILTRGTGNPTFTRATTAYVTDFEGLLKQVPSGCARFSGARFVRNLCPASSASIAIAGNKTVTVGVGTYVFSMGAEATGTCTITFTGTATGSSGTLTANATKRTAATLTITGAGTIIATCTVAAAADIQFEEVTGQSNQNPSEYVSVGVLSAPYHGAGVDGCKYFNTQNGNTVASNVVTEATGAAIASATLEGYFAEGARTNLCLQSQTFGTTWVPYEATIATDSTAAPDGTTTADTLEESVANDAHYVSQSITKAASAIQYTYSVYVKPKSRDWVAIGLIDSLGAGSIKYFDVTNGTIGSTETAGAGFTSVSATIAAAANGFYRCTLTATSTTDTAVNPHIYVATADLTRTFAGDITKGLYLWGAQLEAAAFASSYIPTTTVAVARNADVLTYPSAGNVSGTVGTAYAEVQLPAAGSGTQIVLASGSNGRFIYDNNPSVKLAMYDGVNYFQSNAGATMVGATQKVASLWGGSSGLAISYAGTAVATSAFDGGMAIHASGIGVGVLAETGISQWFGTIKAVRIWTSALSDAQLVSITGA